MKYRDNIEKILKKIQAANAGVKFDDFINNLSSGGPVERSYKKRIGNIVNKADDRYELGKKYYEALDKMYKKFNQ